MNESLISLVSIACGILAVNLLGYLYKNLSFGLIGNSIAGVFGSIFFIKIFGRLGFDPSAIVLNEDFNTILFTLNLLVSMAGGILALVIARAIKQKIDSL